MADSKNDPVGPEYFAPLIAADRVAGLLFVLSAVLSLVVLLLDKEQNPTAYQGAQVSFITAVIALFVTNIAIRLYFFPRAQLARYRDFVAHAYGKFVTYKKTVAYYNNAATTPTARTAAQILESAFFTKNNLNKCTVAERAKISVYLLAWTIALVNRTTELELLSVGAQAVFSEQLLSRWLRFEHFRGEAEKIFQELYRLCQQSRSNLDSIGAEYLGRYEILKATTSYSLSTRVFEKNNLKWNAEWESIRATLKL